MIVVAPKEDYAQAKEIKQMFIVEPRKPKSQELNNVTYVLTCRINMFLTLSQASRQLFYNTSPTTRNWWCGLANKPQ